MPPKKKVVKGRGLSTIVNRLRVNPLGAGKYNYCGPFTKMEGQKPVNNTDKACMYHDIDYENIKQQRKSGMIDDNTTRKLVREADNKMLESMKNETGVLNSLVRNIIKGKEKLEDWKILNPKLFVGNGKHKKKKNK